MKSVGYIFGSFNPIHIGHLSMATQALNDGIVDKVVFVPAKQNPWKKNNTNYIDLNQRVKMCLMSICDYDNVQVSAIEDDVESNYTYDILKEISNRWEHRVVLLTTQETLQEIPFWYKGGEIIKKYDIQILDMPIPIHSTDIRGMIKDGKYPLPYITKNVWAYINENKLYLE